MQKRSLPGRILILIALIIGGFLLFMPFLYTVSIALTKYAYTIPFPPRLIPDHPTLENFVTAWTSNHFSLYTMNSLIIAVSTSVLVVVVTSMTAYGFARFAFPGKEIVFRIMLFTMMVPGMVALIPTFLVMRDLHMLNSRWGLILLYTGTSIGGNTFMLRMFFQNFPKELEEAVLVDGGNRWTIYRHVILPLGLPALTTVAIFTFLGAWDEFYLALISIQDPMLRTLPIAIRFFKDQHATNFGLTFAASLIAMVPPLLFFTFGQRYFMPELFSGSVKG